MRSLVALTARRFEQNRRTDAPVDVLERPARVRIERPGMTLLASDVGFDGGLEFRFSKLSKNHSPELGDIERSGAERDERLPASALVAVAVGPGDPLG